MSHVLPYKIAVLVYLFDEQGRVLLLHRCNPPNQDLYSPIGGKLHMDEGESPAACALREIKEEADITVTLEDLHLTGIVSEAGFEQKNHWLMFLYEVTRPVEIKRKSFREGRLEWHDLSEVERLPIPETDKNIIWRLFKEHRGGFFTVHIDCRQEQMQWRLEHPVASDPKFS